MKTIYNFWWPIHIIVTGSLCYIGYHYYPPSSGWIVAGILANTLGILPSLFFHDVLSYNFLSVISYTRLSSGEEQLCLNNNNIYRRMNRAYCKICREYNRAYCKTCREYNNSQRRWSVYPYGHEVTDGDMNAWLDAEARAGAQRESWDDNLQLTE